MPIQYRIDVIAALKKAGYTTTKIRREKIMGEATLQQMRRGDMVSYKTVDTICRLLHCQPGDLMEYIEDNTQE